MGAKARKQAAARKAVRIGVVTVALAVLATVFAVTAQNGLPDYLPGVQRSTVQAAFADSGALRVGDDVRIANVRAGFVDSIEMVEGKALVTLKLEHGVKVYRDARAAIDARSSLGQKFVELSPGTSTSPALADAAVIPEEQTQSPVELDQLLDIFDEKTRASAGSALRELGGGAGGRGDDLHDGLAASPRLLDDLGKISAALATDDGEDLTSLLKAAASLAGSLEAQSGQIADDVEQLSATVDAVAADNGAPLRSAIDKAPDGLTSAREALRSLDRPLDALSVAGTRLRPAARALGVATPELRGLLRDAVPPLRKIPAVAPQASTAFEALTPAIIAARTTAAGLAEALNSLAPVVAALAPFSSEASDFFTYAANALRHGDAAGHWLRITPVMSPEVLPVHTPLSRREAYPAPGEAQKHGDVR